MSDPDLQFVLLPGVAVPGVEATSKRIAMIHSPAQPGKPTLFWLPGFLSTMTSTKATAVRNWATPRGLGFLSLDYSGHGASEGDIEHGTIGKWLSEARAILDVADAGHPVVIIGSSMGGWIALLLMQALMREAPERAQTIGGLVLIAPAWDMTELIWEEMPEKARQEVLDKGMIMRPSDEGEAGYPITRALIEEGRTHQLDGAAFSPDCPVRILQGMKDEDVPWERTLGLVEDIAAQNVRLILIKDGEHRLSRPGDLAALFATLEEITAA